LPGDLFNDPEIETLPFWRKIVCWTSLALAVGGILVFRAAVSVEWIVGALAMAALGVVGGVLTLPRKRGGSGK